MYWISMQSVNIHLFMQVGAICLQYSHDDVIGKPNIHCVINLSYNTHVTATVHNYSLCFEGKRSGFHTCVTGNF